MTAIEFRSASKTYQGRTVLDSVSLAIHQGEFFVLVGPSGSGKSTLLKLLSGIELPTMGEVWLSGQRIDSVPAYRRPVHTVFQSYALFPHLDVAGNVGFPLQVAGVRKKDRDTRVLAALGLVKLDGFAHRKIATLSGGERQRVAVARALVDEPKCVLFDEPLAALDPHLRLSTMAMIQEIQARLGVTYLYVTHDRQEALQAAHRIGVLRDGKIEQVGTPSELYNHPRTVFVASFLGHMNWLVAEVCQHQRASARLANGSLHPLPDASSPPGSLVLLGIRAENVQVGKSGLFEGEVVKSVFCGSRTQLHLVLADGSPITAELRGELIGADRGARVGVSWDLDAVTFFPAPEGCRFADQPH
jgi:ABC-type Fe3+/spermidine/putrescine transport system ATPase subunit